MEQRNLGIKLGLNSSCLIIVVVYRPLWSTPRFKDLFHEVVSDLCTKYQQILVLGDFNYHWDSIPRDCVASGFGDNMTMIGLKQIVDTPTHEKGHTWTSFGLPPHLRYQQSVDLVAGQITT